ncbi:MAG: 23S rRNA (uracil(1939)-C(5))-methyltransferase RlmD [Ruminococcaceae bacterium]|nr:23S rRNA (uracil(1939)-C(5))-methyltransferase RlmD [Oscillospiraceae bacterium]
MKKNDFLTLTVDDLNNLGCGVGHAPDGRAVFVKGAVTGDTVRVKIIKVNQSYCVARLEELLSPSPYRLTAEHCTAPLSCGGCVYRHITYEHELDRKRSYVEHAFRKAGLASVTVLPVRATKQIFGYRNKGQYPLLQTKEGVRAGFYATGTHRVISADGCAIQNPAFAPIVAFVCSYADKAGWSVYDEITGKGLLRHIYLRIGEQTGEIMVCLVINGDRLPNGEAFAKALCEAFPAVVGVLTNINRENTNVVLGKSYTTLRGKAFIEDELCGLCFRISPDSFYQVNRKGAELLYGLAADSADLQGNETLLDLYCGTGTIGLSMASRVKRVLGAEIVPAAVACAKENAARNKIANAEFFCADAGDRETILRMTGGERPDVVVIDPPRKGSTKALAECLASLEVPKIVYVSCAPDTLARDCKWFSEAGYTIGSVQPVDMFPRTGHVESVVCLTRTFNN